MNRVYTDEPDPAQHLWDEEQAAWDAYRGNPGAPDSAKIRWWAVEDEIERVRNEAGWPRLKEETDD